MTSTTADIGPWPPLHSERLGAAVAGLVGPVQDASLAAQLSALAAVVSSIDARRELGGAERDELEHRLQTALDAADEPAVIAAARSLARFDRAAVPSVDWSAVSGG